MEIIKQIQLKIDGQQRSILFGIANTKEEKDEMYKLRYQVYKERDYIDEKFCEDKKDIDEYDRSEKCIYIIAKLNDEVIASARLIKDEPLPIERDCFVFDQPQKMKIIPKDKRIEVGRLVAKKMESGQKFILPRNLTLLGILASIVEYCTKNHIDGGYVFVKKSLKSKFDRLKVPMHLVRKYKQIYNKNLLRNYFSQPTDPVYPAFFLRPEMEKFINSVFDKKSIFKKVDQNKYTLRDTLYTRFLRRLKII